MKPILTDRIYRDGRGPELSRAWFSGNKLSLAAVDFYNPDDSYTPENLKHLLFLQPQAFRVTPEEEFPYDSNLINWKEVGVAAIVDLGRSEWAKSFSCRHSSACHHYFIEFYDELLEILCEGIEVIDGGYSPKVH